MTAPRPRCCGSCRRREELGSTGVGRGIAIPHCRSLVVQPAPRGLRAASPGVEWDAIDGRPVHHLLPDRGTPDRSENQYLPVLGKIAQFAKDADIPDRLASLASPADFFALLESRGV